MLRIRALTPLLLLAASLFAQDKPQPLRIGSDSVGESIAIYLAHDPECFQESHLQVGSRGNRAVAGCDIDTRKGEVITLAGIPVSKRHAMMDKDRVVSLAYEFKHRDYQSMRAAFVKELGPPRGRKTDAEEDGCAGEVLAWKNEVSVVNLQECLVKGELSVAVFGLLDFISKTETTQPKAPAQ